MIQIDEKQVEMVFFVVDETVKVLNNEIGLEGKPVTIDGLLDSLNYLRVLAKYTVLDLEATCRERDFLKKIIDERSTNGQGTE